MTSRKQSLWKWGEEVAACYLMDRGYQILERNRRTPYGEIDMVTWLPISQPESRDTEGVVVFIEVKTRASTSLGYPEISITPRKQAHMLDAAHHYLVEHPELKADWRIDVIAIQHLKPDHAPAIQHFENVFS